MDRRKLLREANKNTQFSTDRSEAKNNTSPYMNFDTHLHNLIHVIRYQKDKISDIL